MKIGLGYYRADWAGSPRALKTVSQYTDFTFCEAGAEYHGSWSKFSKALLRAPQHGLKIHLSFEQENPDKVVALAAPVWDSIELIDVMDEPPYKKKALDQTIAEIDEAVGNAGLLKKKVGAVFNEDQILNSNGWQAGRLGWRGLEVYVGPQHQGSLVDAIEETDRVFSERIAPFPKVGDIVVVGMARTLDGKWQSMQTLRAVQQETYRLAKADGRVTHLRWFDWGGKDGTSNYPALQAKHRYIAKQEAAL